MCSSTPMRRWMVVVDNYGITALTRLALEITRHAFVRSSTNAAVDAVDSDGWTAPIWAHENGHEACARGMLTGRECGGECSKQRWPHRADVCLAS